MLIAEETRMALGSSSWSVESIILVTPCRPARLGIYLGLLGSSTSISQVTGAGSVDERVCN